MKILYVEDEIAHVELAQRTLEDNIKDRFVLLHCESFHDAIEILKGEPDIDVVLSDLRLPDGSGLDLLKKIREKPLPPAVVLVTGQGDEQVAVAALKAGAADYLVKQSDYLHRLPVVITNAVAQNNLAREQAAKREAEVRYQSLVEQTPAVVFLDALDEIESIYVSPRIEELTGFTPEEWMAENFRWEDHIFTEDKERILKENRRTHDEGSRFEEEYRFIRKDGHVVWIKEDTNLVRDKDGNPLYWQGILIDLTKEKENEVALQRQLKELRVLNAITLAGTEGNSDDEIIERVVQITTTIYDEVCGVLLLNPRDNLLTPHSSYNGANVENWKDGTPINEGVTGKSVLLGIPIRLGDVSKEPAFIEIASGIWSELCVPIRINKRIIGIFNVESKKPDAFDEEDEQFLSTVAGTLGTALENNRLFREEHQRAREVNALYEATKPLTQSLKPEIIANNLMAIIENLLGYDYASIYLLDDQEPILIPLAISPKSPNLEILDRDLEALYTEKRQLGQGIIGWVAEHGHVVRSGDVTKEERYLPVIKNIRSELCVPITVRDKIIGAVNVETTRVNAYSERDENLLTALANTAAVSLENARLYETERARREEAESLREATASLSIHIGLEPLLEKILDSARKIVPFDSASIFYGTEDAEMKIVAARGFSKEDNPTGMVVPSSIKWKNLISSKQPLIIPDTQIDPQFEKWKGYEKIHCWMGVPMVAQGKVIGFINFDSHRVNAYTERDTTLAQTFANSAAVAIQNAILFNTEREQRRREESLLELMRVTTSTLELDEVIQIILQHLLSLIPSDSGTIQLLEGSKLRITATQGFNPDAVKKGQTLQLEDSIIKQEALNSFRPIYVNDTKQDSGYKFFAGIENINSFMVVPLVYKENPIGLATLDSKTINRYTQEDAEFAATIANQAAIAIGNARLYQEALQASERRAVLHRISQDIIRFTQDYEKIYSAIHDAADKLMPCDVFLITLLDDSIKEITVVYAVEAGRRYPSQMVPAQNGFTANIIKSGKSLILKDDADIAKIHVARFGTQKHVQSLVAIPMQIGGKIIGTISAQCYQPYAYGEEEQALLEMLATHAATAIENARLFQEEKRRTQIIETLVDIANEIATTQDIIPVLDKITKRAMDLLDANHVAIYLLHDDNHTLKVISAQGVHRVELLTQVLNVGDGITGNVVANGKPEIINLVATDKRRIHLSGTPTDDAEYETMMSAPLILRGRCIGAVNVWRLRSTGIFNPVELSFLTSIANQISVAIESANLFKETVRRAQESAAIAEVGRDISATLQLNVVLNRIATYAKDLLSSESSAVYLLDPSKLSLSAIAAQGQEADAIRNDPIEMGAGILGDIAANKYGEIVNNSENDPRAIAIMGTEANVREHIMGVPVLEKDQLTGLVVVWRSGIENEYKPSDLDFLSSLAQQAATAIKNASLYDEAQRRLREVETINRLSSSMRETQSQTEMCNILLDEALAVLDASNGSVWIHQPSINMIVQRAARGAAMNVNVTQLKFGDGIVGHVLTTGNSYISSNLKEDPFLFDENRDAVFKGYGGAGIPIYSTDGILGVLIVQLESSRRVENRLNLLETLAGIAGNSIHRADLFEQSLEQVRKLMTLRDIDAAIASSTDLRVTLNILMDHALRHLKVDAVDILIYHPELQSLTFLCSIGFRSASPTRPLIRIGEGLAGQVVMKGRLEHIPNLQEMIDYTGDPILAREGFSAYIGIPLIVKGQIKGVFEIFNRSPLSLNDEWMHFMQTLAGQAAIAIDNSQLFDNLQRSNQEIRQAYDTTLEGWARALELRDRETEGHTRRVTKMTVQLARYMGVSDDDVVNIYRGVLLHDIGKMGVPDQILRKTGPLADHEWAEMRKHPQYAFDLLSPIPYLRPALDIPYCHHEHWDGSGYPRGLKGEQIPLAARIFSIVDIWDALLSDRPYRDAWPEEKVTAYIKDISGTILDPNVVKAFLKMIVEDL